MIEVQWQKYHIHKALQTLKKLSNSKTFHLPIDFFSLKPSAQLKNQIIIDIYMTTPI